ncbi:MAG: carbohydrate-binding domain-containing protein, partial [Gammaproteobacteria bacterium]|nr:carbohydrate-binding domain-containing protein [Gammaproteobacteria bacterium]
MKNKVLLPFSLLALLALAGCSLNNENTGSSSSDHSGSTYDYTTPVVVDDPDDIEVVETTDDFSLTTEDGTFTEANGIYTITAAGTYSASGKLTGQILVEAGEEDEVVIEFNGVSITYGKDSPIKVVSAGKVEISAKKDTDNVVTDSRSAKS